MSCGICRPKQLFRLNLTQRGPLLPRALVTLGSELLCNLERADLNRRGAVLVDRVWGCYAIFALAFAGSTASEFVWFGRA